MFLCNAVSRWAHCSSLVFFAECYIVTDSDLPIPNYKNEVQLARVKLLRHALPISSLILRKKPTVLQSIFSTELNNNMGLIKLILANQPTNLEIE